MIASAPLVAPLNGAPEIEEPVERIGVFRALLLGDMLCAVPALRALHAAFPAARLTLVGLPWVRALAERLHCIDEVIEFPGYPGLPEVAFNILALPRFFEKVQAQRFDLAVQLHGSGAIVNPLVAAFGARQTAGFFDASAWVPTQDAKRYVPWPESGHEVERLLRLTDALQLPRQGTHLEFPIHDDDRDALETLWPGAFSGDPYICVHAGAPVASTRGASQRFAAVADALVDDGYTVVLTGAASELPLAASVTAAMRRRAVSLVGKTSLWTLGALIEGAERIVCNDAGVSHIAAALRTPSAAVSCDDNAAA